jgi:Ca2+-binding EF-hand superfamily protein
MTRRSTKRGESDAEVAANFDAMDTDKDGTVSRAEVKAYEKFAKKDKDADGTLDKGEPSCGGPFPTTSTRSTR